MRGLGRYATRVAVRRVVAIVVLALLAWAGMGRAEAACSLVGGNPSGGYNNGDWVCATEVEAFNKVNSMGPPSYYANCEPQMSTERATTYYTRKMYYGGPGCGMGYYTTTGVGTASWSDESCGDRADTTLTRPAGVAGVVVASGTLQCHDSCVVALYSNGDGTYTAKHDQIAEACDVMPPCDGALADAGYTANLYKLACEPPVEECEAGQTKDQHTGECKDACPLGKVLDGTGTCIEEKNECPAGQTKGPDSSCVDDENACPAGKVQGDDGTCKNDADEDGEPDEDDPEQRSFSGGDTCDVPPACSGDPILCGQARIQWRIDCNTRKNRNVSGGTCAAIPICTGENCDALEYASLLQQWRASCHLEQLANEGLGGGSGGGAGDANQNGVPDVMEGTIAEGEEVQPGVTDVDGGALWGQVDQGGFLGAGACPGLPTWEFMGKTFNVSEKPCEQGALLGNLLIAFALAAAAMIIGRAAAGG